MASKVWLAQVARDKENSQPAYCVMAEHPLDPIATIILEGARMDKLTTQMNRRFLDILTGRHVTANNKLLNMLSIVDEEVMTSTSKDIALAFAEDNKVPFFIPFHFLHSDQSQAADSAQLDVHERILFQVLHAWDSFESNHRLQFVKAGLQKYAAVSHAEDIYTIAMMNKRYLITLMFVARGRYLKVVNTVLNADKTRLTAEGTSHANHESDTMGCDGCFHKYYMNKYYMQLHDGVAKMESFKSLEEAQLKRFLNPDHLQSLVVQVLYFIWSGILNFPEEKMIDYKEEDFRVHFKTTADGTTPSIFLKDPAFMGGPHILCNHALLKKRVCKTFFFHMNYANVDSTIEMAEGKMDIVTYFDDNNLSILPGRDKLIFQRLTTLEKLMELVSGEVDMMPRVNKLINKHFAACPKNESLWWRVRWVCFEMIYNRFTNVLPELLDHTKHGRLPEEEAKRRRLQLTFSLRTLVDEQWKRNETRSARFIEDVSALHLACQQVVITRICREEDKKLQKAQTPPSSSSTLPPQPKKKSTQLQQQQSSNFNEDETNSNNSDKDLQFREEQELLMQATFAYMDEVIIGDY